ncbi:MAG: SufD family Fe-S cluster assembly protein [Puniceicoccales bacterium]|jgi:Fe-S cluster assembly protein SufD|nr:SufD family Fe-S cluster assembly protein [Puniceicoccales bacterium]
MTQKFSEKQHPMAKEQWRFSSPETFGVPLGRLLAEAKKEMTSPEEDFCSQLGGNTYDWFDLCATGDWAEREIFLNRCGDVHWEDDDRSIWKYAFVVEEGMDIRSENCIRPVGAFQANRIFMELRRGAHVKFSLRFEECPTVLSVLKFVLCEQSSLEVFIFSQGVMASRLELEVQLKGEMSSAAVEIRHLGDQDHRFDCRTKQCHTAPHTTSHLKIRTVLDGQSRLVFGGKVVIAESAVGSKASQKNENLMLSGGALAHSLPELDIRSKEVECSHGATVVPLDEEVLFYMASRGIERDWAKRLLREAFLGNGIFAGY